MNEQAKIELIRHAYQYYIEKDISRLLSCMTDDVKWELPVIEGIPFTGKRSGRAEVEKFFRMVDELQEMHKFHPQDFVAQGDKVIVTGHYEWTVKATGSAFACDWVHVFGLAGHHIDKFKEYTDTNRIARAYQP